jgi:rsbT co-antagonist protein RsbR
MKRGKKDPDMIALPQVKPQPTADYNDPLLRELVAHLRQNRAQLREVWARNITDAQLLTAMSPDEIFSEATSFYDNYVEVLETGSVEALQDYARNLSERIIPRGVETHEVIGIVLLLRDVLARSLFKKYQHDFNLLNRVLDAYEPVSHTHLMLSTTSLVYTSAAADSLQYIFLFFLPILTSTTM